VLLWLVVLLLVDDLFNHANQVDAIDLLNLFKCLDELASGQFLINFFMNWGCLWRFDKGATPISLLERSQLALWLRTCSIGAVKPIHVVAIGITGAS
jgi:hypothetical protein